ncbi:SOS response-associated peptidase [Spirosoma montaniterrae]|uniref:Abasic site processing protein n=1 Tax=Spirosoma montaniterrae TaxID=1178516 RepID=A0A1P9WVT9_9BACT|nr:SOS response-associated peptidase [Spirosoma montaniterrae]AQG79504.1 hypothetical protein AWR27_09340 [Spirosoma montaniterrae]
MCYHKSLNVTAADLQTRYDATMPEAERFQPVYHANAYEFPAWPIVTRQQPGQLQLMKWGLIPHWVKSPGDAAEIRTRTINARSETIYEKPSYRTAAQKGQRCLIPVTGFFEWYTTGKKKYPFYINAIDQNITSIAGLWDEWPESGATPTKTGELIPTYTLLTTDANPLLAAIHNTKKRMPCLLTPEQEYAWLHENLSEKEVVELLSAPYPAERMHSHSISKRITSRTEPSDVPTVLEPAIYPELAQHPELFT